MPIVKLKHIVSFSSEDPAHPADNLLKSDTYRKWQCADPSEKQASIIIEFEKAYKINSVDVGNNGSAFVEVLVGRSSSSEYQVLLVASSFMSPAESKSGMNKNRVRMFGSEKLSKAVVEQKWDRVKLVCTQPYNKMTSYGLSFVNFHSPELSAEKNGTQEKPQTKLGAFILKDEPVDRITSGSLFARRKVKTETSSSQATSTAAELREASKHPVAMASTSTTKPNLKSESTERQKESETPSSAKRKADSAATRTVDVPKAFKKDKAQPPVKKEKVSESRGKEVAINKILENVVFVLSGFKNPERGHLRDKAMSMGARYRGDWDTSCTHLVCAFMNTPKYCQVKATGKGKIVSQKWLHDCLSKKKRLSEKRYRLRGDDSDDDSSTDDDDTQPPAQQTNTHHSTSISTDQNVSPSREPRSAAKTSESISTRVPEQGEVNKTDGLYEEKRESLDNTQIIEDELSSGHDTEDEIKRVMEGDLDPYDCSTDCETDDENDDKTKVDGNLKDETPKSSTAVDLLNLPDFFSKLRFFLFGEFDPEERGVLVRYITAYDGEVEEYMSDEVKYVITNANWDDNFDEALVDNSSLTFVRPKWIYACHEKRLFVPCQPYIVVPR